MADDGHKGRIKEQIAELISENQRLLLQRIDNLLASELDQIEKAVQVPVNTGSHSLLEHGTPSDISLGDELSHHIGSFASNTISIKQIRHSQVVPHFSDLALAQGWATELPCGFQHLMPLDPFLGFQSSASRLQRLIRSAAFKRSVVALILAHCVFLGIEIQIYATRAEHFGNFDVINIIFVTLFSAELMLRIAAERLAFFKKDVKWNLFDAVLILTSLFEVFSTSSNMPKTTLTFRTVRLVRATRSLHIMHVLSDLRTLQLMLESLLASMASALWTGTLVVTVLYVFSLLLTSRVVQACRSNPDLSDCSKLQTHFGTIGRTMLTLLEAVFGGMSWTEFSRPLSSIGLFYELLFIGFILVIELVVFNVITGVVVEGAVESASKHQEVLIQEQVDRDKALSKELRKLFDTGDENRSGFMTLTELENFMKDDRVKAHMRALGIDIFQAAGVFRLLDTDNSGAVEADEFIMGCMRLQGHAKALDLATVLFESKKVLRYVRAAVHEVKLESACIAQVAAQDRLPKPAPGLSQARLAMQDHIEQF